MKLLLFYCLDAGIRELLVKEGLIKTLGHQTFLLIMYYYLALEIRF